MLIFFWNAPDAPPVAGTGGQAGLIFFWFGPGTEIPPEPEPSTSGGSWLVIARRRRRQKHRQRNR